MKQWVAVTRALPTTFVVYVVVSIFSMGLGTSLGDALDDVLSPPMGRPATRVAAIEGLIALSPLLRAKAVDFTMALILLSMLSPWLHMAWLTSLSGLHGPGNAFRSGRLLYFRAVLTSLTVGTLALALLAPWLGLSYGLHSFLSARTSDRVHDLAVLAALSPCIPTLVACLAWHDLARARCLGAGALTSAMAAARDAFSPGVLTRYVLWTCLGLALGAFAQALSAQLAPSGLLASVWALALLQALALARSIVRSAWLASALLYVDASEAKLTRSQRRSSS